MDPFNNTNPSENETPNSSLTISPLFCDPDADVTFKSSDGVLFKIYKKYLEATSAGFDPPPFVETDEEPVSLQEPSEVLEILFRFIHPPTESQKYRQPNMAVDVQPEILFAVAEAAEKYVVFGAMSACFSRMEHIAQATGHHPLEILNHCYKHGYEELADQVAPHTITLPLTEVAAKLTSPGLLAKWVVYYDHWMELSRFTRRHIQNSGCSRVRDWEVAFFNAFAKNPRCVFSPPSIPTSPNCAYNIGGSCRCHTKPMNSLFLELSRKGNNIPKFTSIQITS